MVRRLYAAPPRTLNGGIPGGENGRRKSGGTVFSCSFRTPDENISKFLLILIYFADFFGGAELIDEARSRVWTEKGRAWNDERLPILKKKR